MPDSSGNYPRWLPSPSLRDRETHLAYSPLQSACGAQVMWAQPGHPATQRPHCSSCERVLAAGK
ncbi:hypothetical protein GCM10027597_01650 [Saccharopolyspora tripterygii]